MYKCPTAAFDCPYYEENGTCTIGEKPWEECDDAAYYHDWDADEEEDDEE